MNATIISTVVTESGVGRLKEGQMKQKVGNQCTELEYSVFAQDSSCQVEVYADGPCTNLGISKQIFSVIFLPCTCAIGFQPSKSQIDCECVCDHKLHPYGIRNCSYLHKTIQIETNILWIWVANSKHGPGYIIHECPFDYCAIRPLNISLSNFQDRDSQCAFNRSGFLCGQCKQGLCLMLATSKCEVCSDIHLLLIIALALAGIGLVILIPFFNITIAVGTINGLIFYSNLLPTIYFTHPSALTVFISWINLDLGIETCFYNGMTSQAKLLLQLVFPAYMFLLVILIVILSRYSNFFARLLTNRNPVAALCTLIVLSYSKLLRFIIAAVQSTILEFPDGSHQRVWLSDANIQYFAPSHTPQFVAAVIILITGGLLTLQLFFAQWFPRCSKWKLMKWTRNTKYTAFMDAYHAPFTRKHRYWIGLLLFALIVHNIIAATATNDFLPVLSMGCIAIGIILLKLINKRVHKRHISSLLENSFLFNLVFLAFGTLYLQTAQMDNSIRLLGDISIGISAGLFTITICYHLYKFVCLQSRLYRRHKAQFMDVTTIAKKKVRRRKLASIQTDALALEEQYRAPYRREPDLDVLAPITTDDYRPPPPPRKAPPVVTCTVVETPH